MDKNVFDSVMTTCIVVSYKLEGYKFQTSHFTV